MGNLRLTAFEAVDIYLRRGNLTSESTILVRVRVAIKIADRLYQKVNRRIDESSFPSYLRAALKRLEDEGHPHILAEELEDVASSWEKDEMTAQFFARARMLQSARVIRKTKYGGRRG